MLRCASVFRCCLGCFLQASLVQWAVPLLVAGALGFQRFWWCVRVGACRLFACCFGGAPVLQGANVPLLSCLEPIVLLASPCNDQSINQSSSC